MAEAAFVKRGKIAEMDAGLGFEGDQRLGELKIEQVGNDPLVTQYQGKKTRYVQNSDQSCQFQAAMGIEVKVIHWQHKKAFVI